MVVREDDVMQACPNDIFPLHEDVFLPFCKRRKAEKEEKEMARICEIFSSKDHSLEHESFMAEFGMCLASSKNVCCMKQLTVNLQGYSFI